MDWSEKVLCIKCNEGGNLLVCCENGCPLAVHEGCLSCPPRFDGAGCYYCPYCCYKQAVAESRKARKLALEKKKALSLFMDESKRAVSEKHIEESKRAESNEHNESKSGEANEKISKERDQSVQLEKEQKVDNAEEEKVQKDDSEGSSGSDGQDPSPTLHVEQSISNEEARNQEDGGKKNQEEEHVTSAASIGENPSRNMHKHNIFDFEEENIQEEQCATPSPSSLLPVHARTTRKSKTKKSVERDSEAVSAQTSPTMNEKTSRRSSSATETKKGSNQKVDSPKRLKQPEKSPLKLGKRKGLLWTEAEEDALKAGVAKFSKETNANMPWRKILLLGEKVFNPYRTPSDLKDKWKRMHRK